MIEFMNGVMLHIYWFLLITDMVDFTGWVATAVMVAGSVDIAHKRVRGLWLMLLGNVCWFIVGVLSDITSLVGASIVMGGLDLYGIVKWNKRE
jgi:hypothetical protein